MNTAGGRQAAETGTDGLTLVQLHFFVFHLGLIYLRAAQMASTIHHLGSEAPLCDTVPKQECTTCGKTGTTVDAAAGDGGSLSESSTSLLQCSGCHSELYCDSMCQAADWKPHKHACKLVIALRNNDIEKALTAFTKRFQSLLDLVSQSIPDFTLLGDEFKEPRSRVWVLLLKQGTTLRGVPKLEVENVNPEFMHIIFHEYPSFKNEWLEKRKLAKQDANNDGVSFAIVTYKSAVRMVVYTKKKSDLTPFKGQPPAHPRLLVNLINSTIEPGRVYSHGSFQFKLHYARHGESGPVQG